MIIQWKPGTRFNIDAEIAFYELERISEQYGTLRPESVVEESKPEDAPLHDVFEWNNDKAANLYRIEQARHLIRSIVIVRDEDEDKPKEPVRAFVLVKPEPKAEPSYLRIDYALSTQYTREQVLENARRDLEAWKRRYEALLEFADLQAVVGAVFA